MTDAPEDIAGARARLTDAVQRRAAACVRWVKRQRLPADEEAAAIRSEREFAALPSVALNDLDALLSYLSRLEAQRETPIDMILFCPKCGLQHVDAPEVGALGYFGEWDNPPHRSHLCHGCGHIWRPCDRATNGVASITTQGRADHAPVSPESRLEAARRLGDAATWAQRMLEARRRQLRLASQFISDGNRDRRQKINASNVAAWAGYEDGDRELAAALSAFGEEAPKSKAPDHTTQGDTGAP